MELKQVIFSKLLTTALPINPGLAKEISIVAAQRIDERDVKKIDSIEDALTRELETFLNESLDKLSQKVTRDVQHDVQQASLPATAELASHRQRFVRHIVHPSVDLTDSAQKQEFIAGLSEGTGETAKPEPAEALPLQSQLSNRVLEPTPTFSMPLRDDIQPEPTTKLSTEQTDKQPKPRQRQLASEAVSDEPSIEERIGAAQERLSERYGEVEAEQPDDLLAGAGNIHDRFIAYRKKATDHEYRERKKLAREIHTARGGKGGARGITERAMYRTVLGKFQKKGEQLGEKIQENIKQGKFTSFALALGLAVTKDIIDALEVSEDGGTIVAPLLSFMLFVVLTAILWGEGTFFKTYILRKFFGVRITMAIADFIPVIDVFPWWTVSILLMQYQTAKIIRKQKTLLLRQKMLLKKIQLQMKLYRLKNRGKELNPHQLRTIEAELAVIEKEAK